MLYQFAVAPSSMVWMGIYWVGGKCTFNVVSSAVMLNRHRLYKLFACYVSTLSVVRSRVRNPLSGWTLGTTSMTGQPPTTRIMRITCRRSDLSHQAGLSLNPDSQLSMSQCIVRPRLTLLKPNLTIQGEISKTRSRYDSYLHQTARSSQTDSHFEGGCGTVTFYFSYGRSAWYGTPCLSLCIMFTVAYATSSQAHRQGQTFDVWDNTDPSSEKAFRCDFWGIRMRRM